MGYPRHFKNQLSNDAHPSAQILTNGKGDSGPGKQAKDGRANTNAGSYDQKSQPWFDTDTQGRIIDWRSGQ